MTSTQLVVGAAVLFVAAIGCGTDVENVKPTGTCPDRSTITDSMLCPAADDGLECFGIDPSCNGVPDGGPFTQCACGPVAGMAGVTRWGCAATSCLMPVPTDAGHGLDGAMAGGSGG